MNRLKNSQLHQRLIIALSVWIVLFVSHKSFAEPHKKGLISSVNVGARYSSLLVERGVVFYNDFQIDPVLTLFLFDDRLEFLGNSLSYRDFIYSDSIRWRTRLRAISDDPLFPNRDSIRNASVGRKDTTEWVNSLEFFLGGYTNNYWAEIDINYSRDLSVHEGNYIDVFTKFKAGQFTLKKTLIEPNLVAGIGWGDKKHNQYFYGPSDYRSGFTNFSIGFWIALPEKVDRFYPNLQLVYFSTIGDHSRKEYSSANNEGVLLSFITAFRII